MQKKSYIFCFLLILAAVLPRFFQLPNITTVFANETFFAKAISKNVKLYRSTSGDETFSNVYFVIPQSYYIQIDKCENDLFFFARYIDVYGYVKKSEVQCVGGVPETPFANATFRVFVPGGVELRSSPSQSQGINTIEQLGYLETNLKYYGEIEGEEAISNRTQTWFFCKYIKNGKEYFGYVYNAFCDSLTEIPTNTEVLEYIDEPNFTVDVSATPSGEDGLSSLPSATQIVIIIAVCLPCLIIIYLLFRPTKITAKALEEADLKPRKKRKKIRHQDYYEYDE